MNNLDKYKLLPGMRTIKRQLKLLLRHHRMPGDILTMTPLIRDLKKTYGDQIQIYCDTPQGQEVWENNPYLYNPYQLGQNMQAKGEFKPDETYCLDNKMAMENEARGLNMAEAFRQDFMRQSGLHLIASDMWPDIFLTQKEIDDFKVKYSFRTDKDVKYWVVCPGNKSSCQVKIWPRSRWMQFFLQNKDYIFAQIGQSKHGHKPFEFDNVHNYIDKTTLRELFVLIYLSQGTIGYASLHMHIAAAFNKPSVVLVGGRESPSLFRYPNHYTGSMVGSYPCCQYGGCYQGKKKTVKECCGENCFIMDGEDIPKCMDFNVETVSNSFKWVAQQNKAMPAKEKFKVTLQEDNVEAQKELSELEKKILCTGDGYVKKPQNELSEINVSWDSDEKKVIRDQWEYLHGKPVLKPLFRMICNATCYGGGEKTAIRIMRLMEAKGYRIEFIPVTGDLCRDVNLIDKFPKGTAIRHVLAKEIDVADIVFFQANDTLYRYYVAKVEDWVAPWFKAAKRKIIGVNYTTWGLENSAYAANVYICQSEKLRLEFIPRVERIILPNRRSDFLKDIHVLKPPADLSRFFDYDYSKRHFYANADDQSPWINFIRHSSQGDQKYDNLFNKQIRTIIELDLVSTFYLMPPPSFLSQGFPSKFNRDFVHCFNFNQLSIEGFLSLGNVFWYWVPKDKFIEAGCNAVLEAMAAGLPILCNDNGGLVDMIDDEVGWMCRTEEEMYEAIKNMTMDDIKKKGQAAKEKVKKLIDPEAWTNIIIGE